MTLSTIDTFDHFLEVSSLGLNVEEAAREHNDRKMEGKWQVLTITPASRLLRRRKLGQHNRSREHIVRILDGKVTLETVPREAGVLSERCLLQPEPPGKSPAAGGGEFH
jgi:hypothetical protein